MPNKQCQNAFKSGEVWLLAVSVTNIFDMDERDL